MSDSNIIISKNKQSLEYIPSPCLKSHKLKIMRKLIGRSAELMYSDLLKFIGSQKHNGYWIEWNKDAQNVFLLEFDYTQEEIQEYIKYYLDENIFSKEIFEKYNILTGEEIQQYWLLCAKKRMRFVEGIIESIMVVPFEKEVEENNKKFSKLNKLLETKTESIENEIYLQPENLVEEYDLNEEYLQELIKNSKNGSRVPSGVTSSSNLQYSKAISKSKNKSETKSECNNISEKKFFFHPTDVIDTNFCSTDEKNNSSSSELLLGCFENEKNMSNSSNSTQTNKNESPPSETAKAKKTPHPAREAIISIWEKGNKLKYVQNKENNMAIPPLIRKLEGLLDSEGNIVTDANIIQKFTWLWTNKGLLSDFLQKQYRNFTSLDKYFNDIVGDIRDNLRNHSKKNQAIRQPAYMRFISEIPD